MPTAQLLNAMVAITGDGQQQALDSAGSAPYLLPICAAPAQVSQPIRNQSIIYPLEQRGYVT